MKGSGKNSRISPEMNPYKRFWIKFRNTFLTPTWLWKLLVRDYSAFHKRDANESRSLIRRIFLRFFWFWPRLQDAKLWRDRSVGGDRGPQCYVKMEPKSFVLMDEVKCRVPDKGASILDIGCNCGRYLNCLDQAGYSNLYGVDVSKAALDHMEVAFPGLKAKADITRATFQEYLLSCPSDVFDTVYTHGATVELVPSSFPLIQEIARVTSSFVVFLISENGHSSPRFWEYEFSRQGFLLTKLLRPADDTPEDYSSLMVFQKSN